MRHSHSLIIYSVALFWLLAIPGYAVDDYVWTTPSHNSSESMPLGGGDIGMNVWVDSTTNDILCYVSQSGWFDENNSLLKTGRLRIRLDQPAPFVEQRLCLKDGYQQIRFDQDKTITLWVDVMKPIVHIESSSPITISYESWRTQDNPLTRDVSQQSSWKWIVPRGTVTYHDSIVWGSNVLDETIHRHSSGALTKKSKASTNCGTGEVLFWHANEDSTVFDYAVHQQGLDRYKKDMYNPLKNRIFGGHLQRLSPSHYVLTLCNRQCELEDWYKELKKTERAIRTDKDRTASRGWWQEFWQRSSIEAGPAADDTVRLMVRNYNLCRYMLGCNAHPSSDGERWPSKFNGGLFTFNPLDADSALRESEIKNPGTVTPDFRKWGGGTHTAQNQRLLYWPLLKSGDLDALQCQFDYYLRLLPTATLRSRHYWNIEGACFTEQMDNFGLPNPAEYGKHKNGGDPGIEDNKWLEYEWDTSLEFAQMMLCTIGSDNTDKREQRYVDFAISCLRFFDNFYQRERREEESELDTADNITDNINEKENRALTIWPGSACETYKRAKNPSSTIAALQRVTQTLLSLDKLKGADRAYLEDFLERLPQIPTYKQPCIYKSQPRNRSDSVLCIAPAESWDRIQNVETPQLYPVWPWRFTSIADKCDTIQRSNENCNQKVLNASKDKVIGNYDIAFNTYYNDTIAIKHRSHIGWKQDNIWAACLGLKEEAFRLNAQKFLAHPYRFPAFWGPGFDWMPDLNWGGSAMIGLQEMLLQEDRQGNIIILPAWPEGKDIWFRLWASGNRLVEVTYTNGQVTKYKVNGEEICAGMSCPKGTIPTICSCR